MFGARSALVLYTGHFRRELRNHYLEICLGICLHTIPAGRGGTYIVTVLPISTIHQIALWGVFQRNLDNLI